MFSKGQRYFFCMSCDELMLLLELQTRRRLFTLTVSSLSRSGQFQVFSQDISFYLFLLWRSEAFVDFCIDNVFILSVNSVALLWSEFHVITGGCPGDSADDATVYANCLLFVTQTAWKMTLSSPLFVTDLKAWTNCRSRQSSPKKSCRCSTEASKM